ncbi:MAG: hypothetical protein CBC22_00210 [Alphaproteobacteria bacterium TMED62]|nr:MAG: hypothetical protein CBC22_00210 [Alphaproteobacteria bacterium TMED62]|tara:strand:- start:7230 stop:8228 length:999 start_codon:yes stop_codon:yes gene_type:complete
MNIENHVIKIYNTGNSSVLNYEKSLLADPLSEEVRIKHFAIGLNFIDINMRNGNYSIKSYSPDSKVPYILGVEGSGRIESLGKNVNGLKVGDRVAHCMNLGTYSEFMNVNANKLFTIPRNISYEIAAASTLKGLTAHYLIKELGQVKKNQIVVVHAAAGGVGSLLCQWAHLIGAKVIGVVSTDKKVARIRKIGADFYINSRKQNFSNEIMEITEGKGADIIYDSVGKSTLQRGLSCLADRGKLVSYGNSAGLLEPVDISVLKPISGSIICGGLLTFIKNKHERKNNAEELFNLITKGKLKVDINQRYRLKDISLAHDDIESRITSGSSIILP